MSGGSGGTVAAIEQFWEWWRSGRSRVEAAISTGEFAGLVEELTGVVQAIDPGLAWELSKGRVAQHSLCVTAEGNRELRATTERWLLAGPASDTTWEYAAARQADPSRLDNRFEIDGRDVDLGLLRCVVTVDDDRQLIDLVVHHPGFMGMDEQLRVNVSFLALDWLLGEDGVERWVGLIDCVESAPAGSVPIGALPEVVEALEARHVEPTWAILEGRSSNGARMLATARRPLKRIERPLFDLHGEISLDFDDRNPDGLPSLDALAKLREFEDALMMAIPEEQALLAAHVTTDGMRVLHLYCDAHGTAHESVDEFVARTRRPGTRVEWSLDPAWEAIASFQ